MYVPGKKVVSPLCSESQRQWPVINRSDNNISVQLVNKTVESGIVRVPVYVIINLYYKETNRQRLAVILQKKNDQCFGKRV